MRVITNPKKAGAHPNNRLPTGAAPIADSLDPRDLLQAMALGNRATRRLAQRNLRKRLKGQRSGLNASGSSRATGSQDSWIR